MTAGKYQNKLDFSILEICQIKDKRETKLKARWIESKTKQGLEFDITETFNRFETFEKIDR
jgi:hypothetical protein